MAGRRTGRQTLLRAPDRGSGRLSRVGLVSAAPLLLAGGAHLLGGRTPPLAGVALGAVLLVLISACVSLRQCRFPVLVALLGVEQVLLHTLFTATEAAAMCLPAGSVAGGHPGHGGFEGSAGAALRACTEGHAMSPGWLMVTAHVVATVLVAWLLARGEAWWWRTVAELVRLVCSRPTRRRARPVLVTAPLLALCSPCLLATVSPRGPPLPS